MPFIGKSPKAGNYILLDSITTSATATYNLTRNSTAYFPASARNLIVSLNGITQAPDTAYSVSGSTITFSSALTSSDVIDYILVLGDVLSIGTPADNTVGIDQLNVSDGTNGQALTTDGSGTLSFSTVSSSTPTLDAVTGAGATTTNAITVGTFTSTGIDDNATGEVLNLNDSGATIEINQSSPGNGLDFRQTSSTSGTGIAANFDLVGTGSGQAFLDFRDSSGNSDLWLGTGSVSSVTSAIKMTSLGDISFITAGSERMSIDNSGQVTANRLELEGTDDPILILRSTDDGPLYMEFERGTDRHAYLGFGGSGDIFRIWNEESAGLIQFGTNNVERMRIAADGVVTIYESASFEAGIEEQQYSLTGTAIDPANGTIQYKTLSANTTFTESLADGEFVTLMIDDGSNSTVTWPTITWVGGSAPILQTTGYNVIELWQVNGTLYGAFVGTA